MRDRELKSDLDFSKNAFDISLQTKDLAVKAE